MGDIAGCREGIIKQFKDIDALVQTLSAAYRFGEGEVGRSEFRSVLQTVLNFDARKAELYSSTVLSNNSNASASFVSMNAYKLSGRWIRGDNHGTAGQLVVSKTETWLFKEDLTYEHKYESYEGYVAPFGFSYSLPKSSSEIGIWAPSDQSGDTFRVVVISRTGFCRRLKAEWLGSTATMPPACSIDRLRFIRQ